MEFKSFEEAMTVALSAEQLSNEWAEAWAYVTMNAPPPLKKVFDEVFFKCFPDFKPDYFDDQGNPYYSVERAMKYFEVSRSQVDEIAANHPELIRLSKGLSRVQ